jgi:hypothetical protein
MSETNETTPAETPAPGTPAAQTQDPAPEVQEHNDNVLEQAKDATPEGREPGDFTGMSPAATDKIAAKAIDLDRQSAYLPTEDKDLSNPGGRTPFVEE